MDQDLSTSRRERRIASRRTLILEAAARLFAEKGFHRTTTRDIAEAADVSEGTLYNYFENKEEMLLGIMAHLAEKQHLDDSFADEVSGDAREFLRSVLRERRETLEQSGYMLQSVLSEILVNPDLRERYYQGLMLPTLSSLEDHLQSRNESGQVRIDNPALTARVLVGLLQGLFLLEVLGDPEVHYNWDELSDAIIDILFNGVSNQG
jgi:AcrR family transcriptional regulator